MKRSLMAALRAGVVLGMLAGAGLAGAIPAVAQVPTLDRVDSLVTAGAYDDARTTLDRWWSAREAFDVPGSDRVRAHMLRAGLRTTPGEAESDYLSVVLGYPTSEHAPMALLRLGQGLVASGDHQRAAGYLQRLVADYPGTPERTSATLWLARAQNGLRRSAAACRTARIGLEAAGDRSDLAERLRIEEAAACEIGERVTDAAQPTPQRPAGRAEPQAVPAGDRAAGPAGDTAEQPGGRYTAQTGAFRYRDGAESLMTRLRDRGYEPRAVLVPVNHLLRVRVGRFTTAAEAAGLVRTLKAAGFDAFVVSDADRERAP